MAEIKYLEITPDGLLRAPVFVALRRDKDPKECVRTEGGIQEDEGSATETPLIPADSPAEVLLDIEGHRLKLTNLNKVFYPGEGITKRDVINYYDAVAPLILPHLRDRPLSLKRYPNGIHRAVLLSKGRRGQSSRLGAPGADLLRPQSGQDSLHHL